MAGNRAQAEEFILSNLDKIIPGTQNVQIYKDLFAKMSDKEFGLFMKSLEDGDSRLAIIVPNLSKEKLDINRNLALAKELGHDFFERLWIDGNSDVPPYLTPVKYLVIDLPVRRQAQLLQKKISIPEDNKSIDELSGQPTGKSKGSKISYPETQILAALDLNESLTELLKARGGDNIMFNDMNAAISKTGGVSIKAIDKGNTVVKSTEVLSTLLTSMHLRNFGLGV